MQIRVTFRAIHRTAVPAFALVAATLVSLPAGDEPAPGASMAAHPFGPFYSAGSHHTAGYTVLAD